jgi:peptidoglycan hydrolase-like protein with peptidoglycan-binding domain
MPAHGLIAVVGLGLAGLAFAAASAGDVAAKTEPGTTPQPELDKGMDPATSRAVLQALQTESDPANLLRFADSIQHSYPIAAGALTAKAAALQAGERSGQRALATAQGLTAEAATHATPAAAMPPESTPPTAQPSVTIVPSVAPPAAAPVPPPAAAAPGAPQSVPSAATAPAARWSHEHRGRAASPALLGVAPTGAGTWVAAVDADIRRDSTQERFADLLRYPVGSVSNETHNGTIWQFRVISNKTNPQETQFAKEVKGWIWHPAAALAPSPMPAPLPVVTPQTMANAPRNEAIAEVQRKLNALRIADPPLVVDGVNGPKTIGAVKLFQMKHGLKVDGIAGPQTTGALNSAIATSSDVGQVQSALNALGVVAPPLVVDGIAGPKTIAAVRAFQSRMGLKVDGIAGPQTKAALAQTTPAMWNAAIARTPAPPPAVTPIAPAAAAIHVVTMKDVQNALNALGARPPLTVDGIAGPLTKAQITLFQQSKWGKGLKVDGIAGPQTKAALETALAAKQHGQVAAGLARPAGTHAAPAASSPTATHPASSPVPTPHTAAPPSTAPAAARVQLAHSTAPAVHPMAAIAAPHLAPPGARPLRPPGVTPLNVHPFAPAPPRPLGPEFGRPAPPAIDRATFDRGMFDRGYAARDAWRAEAAAQQGYGYGPEYGAPPYYGQGAPWGYGGEYEAPPPYYGAASPLSYPPAAYYPPGPPSSTAPAAPPASDATQAPPAAPSPSDTLNSAIDTPAVAPSPSDAGLPDGGAPSSAPSDTPPDGASAPAPANDGGSDATASGQLYSRFVGPPIVIAARHAIEQIERRPGQIHLMRNAAVSEFQAIFNRDVTPFYGWAPLAVDGIFGPKTQGALEFVVTQWSQVPAGAPPSADVTAGRRGYGRGGHHPRRHHYAPPPPPPPDPQDAAAGYRSFGHAYGHGWSHAFGGPSSRPWGHYPNRWAHPRGYVPPEFGGMPFAPPPPMPPPPMPPPPMPQYAPQYDPSAPPPPPPTVTAPPPAPDGSAMPPPDGSTPIHHHHHGPQPPDGSVPAPAPAATASGWRGGGRPWGRPYGYRGAELEQAAIAEQAAAQTAIADAELQQVSPSPEDMPPPAAPPDPLPFDPRTFYGAIGRYPHFRRVA